MLKQIEFAKHIGVSWPTISQLINGRRGVSPKMVYSLSVALGTSPEFWANAQMIHDLSKYKPAKRIKRITGKSVA